MVPWIAGGSSSWLPNIVGGANSNCTVSFHQHDYSGGPNDPGVLAAGCSLADSLIIAGANRTCSVGLLRILSACSEGADPIGTWAVR